MKENTSSTHDSIDEPNYFVYFRRTLDNVYLTHLLHLLINMQEMGVDDKYGDEVSSMLPNLIKWTTDKIELNKREHILFKSLKNVDLSELTEVEQMTLKVIENIIHCICNPDYTCYLNVQSVAKDFSKIFNKETK